jgi:hypothetical protein
MDGVLGFHVVQSCPPRAAPAGTGFSPGATGATTRFDVNRPDRPLPAPARRRE